MPQHRAAPAAGHNTAPIAPPVPPTPIIEPDESESDESVVLDGPAVIISPVKARQIRKGVVNKSDISVWSLSDRDIIGQHE